jgi:hypothetical protein
MPYVSLLKHCMYLSQPLTAFPSSTVSATSRKHCYFRDKGAFNTNQIITEQHVSHETPNSKFKKVHIQISTMSLGLPKRDLNCTCFTPFMIPSIDSTNLARPPEVVIATSNWKATSALTLRTTKHHDQIYVLTKCLFPF